MSFNTIQTPQGNCNSAYDCLEVKIQPTNLIIAEPIRDGFCIDLSTLPVEDDVFMLFADTEQSQTWTFSNEQDDFVIPIAATVAEQLNVFAETILKNAYIACNYNVTVNTDDNTVCVEAINTGEVEASIGFVSDTLTGTSTAGTDGQYLEDYRVRFFIYCREQTEGGFSWTLLRKTNPVDYFKIPEGETFDLPFDETGYYVCQRLDQLIQKSLCMGFVFDEMGCIVGGFHILEDHSKDIEIRAADYWTENEVPNNPTIQTVGRFTVISSRPFDWTQTLSNYCCCIGDDLGFFKLLTYTPNGFCIAPCGFLPIAAHICVPEGVEVSGQICANVSLEDGTLIPVELSSFTLQLSKTILYNLDLCNDPALLAALGQTESLCTSKCNYPLSHLSYFVKLDETEPSNPLDFNQTGCQLNDSIPTGINHLLTFCGNGGSLGANSQSWAILVTSGSASVVGSNTDDCVSINVVGQSGEFLLTYSAVFDGCVLSVSRTVKYGGCFVGSNFNFNLTPITVDDCCALITNRLITGGWNAYGGEGGEQWDISLDIFGIGSALVGLGATQIIFEVGFNGNYSSTNSLAELTGIPIDECVDYHVKITVALPCPDGTEHCIVLTKDITICPPPVGLTQVSDLMVECEDLSAGEVGLTVDVTDLSSGGDQISSIEYCMVFAAEDANINDLAATAMPVALPFDVLYSSVPDGQCLHLIQKVSSDDCPSGESIAGLETTYWTAKKICFECPECETLPFAQITTTPQTCEEDGSVTISNVTGVIGAYGIVIVDDEDTEVYNFPNIPDLITPITLPLDLGTYTITIIDVATGCQIKLPFTISQNIPCTPLLGFLVCTENQDGSLTIQWTISNTAEYYVVTIFDPLTNTTVQWQDLAQFPDTNGNPDTNTITIEGLVCFRNYEICVYGVCCENRGVNTNQICKWVQLECDVPVLCEFTIDSVDVSECNEDGTVDVTINLNIVHSGSGIVQVVVSGISGMGSTIWTTTGIASTITLSGIPADGLPKTIFIKDLLDPTCFDWVEVDPFPNCTDDCADCLPKFDGVLSVCSTDGDCSGSVSFFVSDVSGCTSPFTITQIIKSPNIGGGFEIFPINNDPLCPAVGISGGGLSSGDPFIVSGLQGSDAGILHDIIVTDADGCASTYSVIVCNQCSINLVSIVAVCDQLNGNFVVTFEIDSGAVNPIDFTINGNTYSVSLTPSGGNFQGIVNVPINSLGVQNQNYSIRLADPNNAACNILDQVFIPCCCLLENVSFSVGNCLPDKTVDVVVMWDYYGCEDLNIRIGTGGSFGSVIVGNAMAVGSQSITINVTPSSGGDVGVPVSIVENVGGGTPCSFSDAIDLPNCCTLGIFGVTFSCLPNTGQYSAVIVLFNNFTNPVDVLIGTFPFPAQPVNGANQVIIPISIIDLCSLGTPFDITVRDPNDTDCRDTVTVTNIPCCVSIQNATSVCNTDGTVTVSYDILSCGLNGANVVVTNDFTGGTTTIVANSPMTTHSFTGSVVTPTSITIRVEDAGNANCFHEIGLAIPICTPTLRCFEANYSANTIGAVEVTGFNTAVGNVNFGLGDVEIFNPLNGGILYGQLAFLAAKIKTNLLTLGFDPAVEVSVTGTNVFNPVNPTQVIGFTLQATIYDSSEVPIQLNFSPSITTVSNFLEIPCVPYPCDSCTPIISNVVITQPTPTITDPNPANGSVTFVVNPSSPSCGTTFRIGRVIHNVACGANTNIPASNPACEYFRSAFNTANPTAVSGSFPYGVPITLGGLADDLSGSGGQAGSSYAIDIVDEATFCNDNIRIDIINDNAPCYIIPDIRIADNCNLNGTYTPSVVINYGNSGGTGFEVLLDGVPIIPFNSYNGNGFQIVTLPPMSDNLPHTVTVNELTGAGGTLTGCSGVVTFTGIC